MTPLRSLFLAVLAGFVTILGFSCGGGDSGGGGAGSGPTRRWTPRPASAKAGEFLERCGTLAKEADILGNAVIPGAGENEWLLAAELRSLGAGKFWGEAAQSANRTDNPEKRDPLVAVLDFDRQMKEAGIPWVFVPVPGKAAVDPTVVPDAPDCSDGRVDKHFRAFVGVLRDNGVPVLDLTDEFAGLVAEGTRMHCRTDSHWTSRACERTAQLIAKQLIDEAWFEGVSRTEYAVARESAEIRGDLLGMKGGAEGAAESIDLVRVSGAPTVADESPVLLFGDSHCLVFHKGGDMHAEGAGLADHLARALSMPVELVAVRGSGATPSRIDVYRGQKMKNKRFAVWCITAREFTESSWSKVPVLKKN